VTVGVAALVVLTAGCAGDDLAARPEPPPSGATWITLWAAAAILLLVGGAVLTWPAWTRRSGSRLASIVLGIQAAALWFTTALGLVVTFRMYQLSGRPPEELPAESLLELGRLGNRDFAWLLLASVLLFLVPVSVVVTVAARFAASPRVAERVAAAVVLALQVGIWGALLLRSVMAGGDRGWSTWLAAVNLPLTFLGAWACWPREVVASEPPPPGSRLTILAEDGREMGGAS
jgi:hypothetical protein